VLINGILPGAPVLMTIVPKSQGAMRPVVTQSMPTSQSGILLNRIVILSSAKNEDNVRVVVPVQPPALQRALAWNSPRDLDLIEDSSFERISYSSLRINLQKLATARFHSTRTLSRASKRGQSQSRWIRFLTMGAGASGVAWVRRHGQHRCHSLIAWRQHNIVTLFNCRFSTQFS